MRKYKIQAEVCYRGRETVTIDIDADNDREALTEDERYDYSHMIDCWNVDFDVEFVNILIGPDKPEEEPRCDKMKDMFT